MTHRLTLPQTLSSLTQDLRELIYPLMMGLISELDQLRSERMETLGALRIETDPDLFQLMVEALQAIDFEIDSVHQEVEHLSLLLD